ncbi:hypothetical protein ACFQL8_36535 [Streptomyces goshikiensis]|uniref:hypothetical protein n=1 Tax=Streptomyces goshikiensis TaxID=1942 RepID=UPI00167767FA|nr:hypothetical protein [Streptomyces goshikiensis]GHD83050.1 hypothetical protein GCM10010336_73420 [Streptomyces goshikiensis]
MTKIRKHNPAPTPPSQAPGESGDPEARKEAEEAVLPDTHEGEAGDASTPSSDAQHRAAANAKTARRES